MAEPAPNKTFRDFKLKEAAPAPTEAVGSECGSVQAAAGESTPMAGGALSPIDDGSSGSNSSSTAEADQKAEHPTSGVTSWPATDINNVGLFLKSEYHGLRRHRLIVCGCLLLAFGIFAMSAVDLQPLLTTEGVIDSSLHITPNPKPPRLNPDLAYYYDPNSPSIGLYKVKENGWNGSKVGLVDSSGKLVVPTEFFSLGDFNEGLAPATVRDKKGKESSGYIDKSGKFVITPKYTSVFPFHDGVAAAYDNRYGVLIDKNGKEIFRSERFPLKLRGDADETSNGLHDDKETSPGGPDNASYDDFSERYGRLLTMYRHDGTAGLLDTTGHWVTTQAYDRIAALGKGGVNGYAHRFTNRGSRTYGVQPASNFKFLKDGLWGILDQSGKEIMAPKFKRILSYQNGHAAVMVGDKYGFADSQGNIVIQPQYDFVTAFDKLIAVKEGKTWKFIDETGHTVNVTAVDGVIHSDTGVWLSDGLGPVVKNNKVGFLNSQGEFTIKPQFEWAFAFDNGYARTWDGSFWHYIDRSGQRVGPNLTIADPFTDGKAAVTVPGPLFSFTSFNEASSMNNGVASWKNRVLGREQQSDEQ